jgi:hypothetical protein
LNFEERKAFNNLAKFLATPVESPTANLVPPAQISDETQAIVVLGGQLVEKFYVAQ